MLLGVLDFLSREQIHGIQVDLHLMVSEIGNGNLSQINRQEVLNDIVVDYVFFSLRNTH